jgi:hypothetical protein
MQGEISVEREAGAAPGLSISVGGTITDGILVGRDLYLVDIDIEMVVDIMPNALPSR